MVDKDSAVLDCDEAENVPVARDHEHLVRFDCSSDDAYYTLCQTLKRKMIIICDDKANTNKQGASTFFGTSPETVNSSQRLDGA